jgi:hypothetical protein
MAVRLPARSSQLGRLASGSLWPGASPLLDGPLARLRGLPGCRAQPRGRGQPQTSQHALAILTLGQGAGRCMIPVDLPQCGTGTRRLQTARHGLVVRHLLGLPELWPPYDASVLSSRISRPSCRLAMPELRRRDRSDGLSGGGLRTLGTASRPGQSGITQTHSGGAHAKRTRRGRAGHQALPTAD